MIGNNLTIERVARAIATAEGFAWDGVSDTTGWREKYYRQARAAIEAMREPTPLDAEVWSCPCCGSITDRQVMKALGKKE